MQSCVDQIKAALPLFVVFSRTDTKELSKGTPNVIEESPEEAVLMSSFDINPEDVKGFWSDRDPSPDIIPAASFQTDLMEQVLNLT